jgi:hypothetical protein
MSSFHICEMTTFDETNTFCILPCIPSPLQDPFINYVNVKERSIRYAHILCWTQIVACKLEYALIHDKNAKYTIPILGTDKTFVRLSDDNEYIISYENAKWLLDTYDGKFVSLERMLASLETI